MLRSFMFSFPLPSRVQDILVFLLGRRAYVPAPLECSLSWESDFSCQNLRPSRATVHDGSVSFGHSIENCNSVQRAEASEDFDAWLSNHEPYLFSV